MKIKLLNKTECLKELERVDAFLSCLNEYTLTNFLKKPSVNEYIKSLAEAPIEFSQMQRENLIEIFDNIIKPKWAEMKLPDIAINMAATNGADMGMSGLPYTRNNTIFFPTQIMTKAFMGTDQFKQLVAHECFHIMSRGRPMMKNKLYKFFGFRLNEDIDIGIVNPDCPINNYSINIDGIDYVPYLEMPVSGDLSDHAMMFSMQSKESVKAKDTKIFDMVGKTTRYVIHPEEICADFFMNLFVIGNDVDNDKINAFKEELIKAL